MTYPGFVSCETLQSKDSAIVFTMSTWQTAGDWGLGDTKIKAVYVDPIRGTFVGHPQGNSVYDSAHGHVAKKELAPNTDSSPGHPL
jgi:hypothetical protein